MYVYAADLCMDQCVVEQDEPVDREPPRILQGKSFVAAFADQTTVWFPQGILTTHGDILT